MVSIAGFGIEFNVLILIILLTSIYQSYETRDYNTMFKKIFVWSDSVPVLDLYTKSIQEYIADFDILGIVISGINAIFSISLMNVSLNDILVVIYNGTRIFWVYFGFVFPAGAAAKEALG